MNPLTDHERARLEHALTDSRNFPSAYPILASRGMMERTANGFVAIDPEQILNRIRELLTP